MKENKEKTLFNATLVTDKGLIVDNVMAHEVEEVIPFLTKRYGIKDVISN